MRLLIFSLALLAGCSFAPIRIAVPDVEIPGNSSGGLVCYTPTPVTESAPAGFSYADYRADALYSSVEDNPATVVVYGRTSPPEAPCVFPSDADLQLSSPITLTPGTPTEVLVGGPDYSGTLADLITSESYYIGASLAGGVLISTEERILLSDGEISVYY
jgi:hypothetical protein